MEQVPMVSPDGKITTDVHRGSVKIMQSQGWQPTDDVPDDVLAALGVKRPEKGAAKPRGRPRVKAGESLDAQE